METIIEFITIVRNDRQGLESTVISLDQAYKKYGCPSGLSHLIIDGDSIDGSVEYIKGVVGNRLLKTQMVSEPDEGIYDAMNKGVSLSMASCVIFLNAGDVLAEDADLEQLIKDANIMMRRKSISLIAYSAIIKFPSKAVLIKSRRVKLNSPKLPTIHQSILYKRLCLLDYSYDLSFKVCGDYEQFANMLSNGEKYITSKMVLSEFFSGGVSSQKPKTLFNESMIISNKYFKLTMLEGILLRIRLIRSLTLYYILNAFFIV